MLIRFAILFFLCSGWNNDLHGQMGRSVRTEAERMPVFVGCQGLERGSRDERRCSDAALVAFINEHLEYPAAAQESGLEGAVYVRFVVDKMGRVRQPEVLRDIGGDCGAAAVAVLEKMPRWQPAERDGETVDISLDLPIHFYLDRVRAAEDFIVIWGDLTDRLVSTKDLRRQLNTAPYVLDERGEKKPLTQLQFFYAKNKKAQRTASSGIINSDMKKMLRKAKKGAYLTVVATIQDQGRLLEVDREFLLVE